jgi:hypothetical protein
MILFVLNDPEKLDLILDAWESVGITGVTIIESTGIIKRRTAQQRIPLRYRLDPMITHEAGHYTLMAIVPNKNLVENCLQATEKLLGNLDLPDTGVFTAWPLDVVKGLHKNYSEQENS